ncbi:IS1380 family transposase [Lactobacillus salivarius]|uniref:IS1380 family transposase n=1 Tax=Lactobacillales TaxID=186826 RepID=UPI000409A902|nr:MULTISPECIES: IS1380 family transposase [Lactobacillales]KEI50835.1 transposase [Enterococcus faecium UC8668]NXZ97317.1 IS1380 family transposase [Ligilactobacillus salivarius]NYA60270.1 IS1380 family transposase [Ligilactobacillus salivarius]NYA63390.1 IS1380 family transposase [Ligilactobacillus salivarius]NYA64655.1 IS1380 family transposase [Ligilactobacillus salivarius]
MVTLQENAVKFNNNLIVSHDGARLSSDSGLILIDELMDAFQFTQLSKKIVRFNDSRKYWTHTNHKLLKQLVLQIVAGYSTDSAANILQHDPVLQTLSTDEPLASQSSISRFYDRVVVETILTLQVLNQDLIDKARLVRNHTNMIIDLDSTHSDTFGHQEETAYNAHYGTNGYHPLVAFDGLTGDFLKAKLRSGNQYTTNGVKEFLEPLLAHYNQTIPTTDILVRGDSGFATPDVYDLCDLYENQYVIRLKANRNLYRLAEEFVFYDNHHPWDEKEVYYHSVSYQAAYWFKPRRVCIRSTREVGELLFKHSFIVTNFSENISAKRVFETYNKRGTMENYIKEAKNSFFFDNTDSPRFIENEARMMISLLAYNLVNFLRTLCFEPKSKGLQVDTIRFRLFKVAGKLVSTARQMYLKLSISHVYQREFYAVFRKIQRIRQYI